jgi:hypothetical protein
VGIVAVFTLDVPIGIPKVRAFRFSDAVDSIGGGNVVLEEAGAGVCGRSKSSLNISPGTRRRVACKA